MMFKNYKTVVMGLCVMAVFCPVDLRGRNSDVPDEEEPPSVALRWMYRVLTDRHPSGGSFDKLLKAYPSEVKSELMRIICLESHYYDADNSRSHALGSAVWYAARNFGHEDKFYTQLKILIKTLRDEYSDPGNIEAGGNHDVNCIVGSVIDGLGKSNMSDEALDKLVDLIDSGLLGPELPKKQGDQYDFAGSRAEAYCALMGRYKKVTDAAMRERIVDLLRHYYQTEVDFRVKHNMEIYLKSYGLSQTVMEITGESQSAERQGDLPIPSEGAKSSDDAHEDRNKKCSSWVVGVPVSIAFGFSIFISVLLIWKWFGGNSVKR